MLLFAPIAVAPVAVALVAVALVAVRCSSELDESSLLSSYCAI